MYITSTKIGFHKFCEHIRLNFPVVYTTACSCKRMLDLYDNHYFEYINK